MNIFMGMHNVGSLMDDYTAGFRALGHEVFSVALSENAITSHAVDMNIPRMIAARWGGSKPASKDARETYRRQLLMLAWRKALESDLCFFIWNTFMPDASDLPLLRKAGKKIVIRFCGSEVRDPEAERQAAASGDSTYTEYGLSSDLNELAFKLNYIRMCERYADLLIGGSQLTLRPTSTHGARLFSSAGIPCDPRQREHPVLLHAPSRRSAKGTEIWLRAFDALRARGLKFTVKLAENIPHEAMLHEYAKADIFCNSLFFSGRASWEAMAGGCVVLDRGVGFLGRYIKDNTVRNLRALGKPSTEKNIRWWQAFNEIDRAYEEQPVVEVTPDSVTEDLAKIIENRPLREELARQGPPYLSEMFSPERTCREILQQVMEPCNSALQARLFWRGFFNLDYAADNDSPERIHLLNRATDIVRDCPWYKKYVVPCERGGLRF